MSDLASAAGLMQSNAQLPVNWYFDQHILDVEQQRLFDLGPGYIGHELMVPNVGDYQTLQWAGHARTLIRNEQSVELISNVCRHRQSIMLKGRGNAKNIVCPLHRWTYALDGKLLGAPHFPVTPCLDLGKSPLTRWNGLLFSGGRDVARDLAGLSVLEDLDFSGYMLDRVHVEEYPFNWKTFIEVYLEDYHVVPFHPGLGNFVNCDDLRWDFGPWHSVQVVGVNRRLSRPGTPRYKRWHEAVLTYRNGETPKFGAIWLTYYPNVMVEWYPHVLVISTVVPRGPQACTNVVEFYYPEDIVLFERDFVEAEQNAYQETAAEDQEICVRMTEGRRALYERGANEVGPYQSPMENGMLHFHEFIRREIAPFLR
ncbi:MAG TPA: aromatic ring-hydroxylating dioxygenase subunit alpha [Burkholderiales bacterium]|nr:aromatic ring-hydroxylating dioxygenase subunit alpha [Burkholderiales bacterium]